MSNNLRTRMASILFVSIAGLSNFWSSKVCFVCILLEIVLLILEQTRARAMCIHPSKIKFLTTDLSLQIAFPTFFKRNFPRCRSPLPKVPQTICLTHLSQTRSNLKSLYFLLEILYQNIPKNEQFVFSKTLITLDPYYLNNEISFSLINKIYI